MAYTSDQFLAAINGLARERRMAIEQIDTKLDKIIKAMVSTTEGMTADHETDQYLVLRELKEKTNGYQDKRDAAIGEQMATLNMRLLRRLKDQGVNSMGAANATFYRETKYRPSCADWKIFYRWIAETDNFEFLEKRVTKKAVVEYLEANKVLPPGINLNSEIGVVVRRKDGKD